MNAIHKTEVLTILRSIVARLEANSGDSDWSKHPYGLIQTEHGDLKALLQFWKGPASPDGSTARIADNMETHAKREAVIAAQANEIRLLRIDLVRLKADNSNLIAETYRWSKAERETKIQHDNELRRYVKERDDLKKEIHRLNQLLSPQPDPGVANDCETD